MSFEEFQAWCNGRLFSQRRLAWRTLQELCTKRSGVNSGLIAYPDCLLFVTPEDFGAAAEAVEATR